MGPTNIAFVTRRSSVTLSVAISMGCCIWLQCSCDSRNPHVLAGSAQSAAKSWNWPSEEGCSADMPGPFGPDPGHLWNRIFWEFRSSEDRVAIALSGWSWLEQNWNASTVSDYDQIQKARAANAGVQPFRLLPTKANRFAFRDCGYNPAVRIVDSVRTTRWISLLRRIADRNDPEGANAFHLPEATATAKARILMQRDLWQLADTVQGRLVKVHGERDGLLAALRTAIAALAIDPQHGERQIAWGKAPYGLPSSLYEESSGGWIEWSSPVNVHHATSRRIMPFEERLFGVWRTFVRFPDSPEGHSAAAEIRRTLAAPGPAEVRRAQLMAGAGSHMPAGTLLAATLHSARLTSDLEPLPVNGLIQVLVRRLGSAEGDQTEDWELSRRQILQAGPNTELIRVPPGRPRIYVLGGDEEQSGLMVAPDSETCRSCHEVRLGNDESLAATPLSWGYRDRRPEPGSARRSLEISMQELRKAAAALALATSRPGQG